MRIAIANASTFLEVKLRNALDFYYDEIRLSDEFYVSLDLSEQVIIGASTMQKKMEDKIGF